MVIRIATALCLFVILVFTATAQQQTTVASSILEVSPSSLAADRSAASVPVTGNFQETRVKAPPLSVRSSRPAAMYRSTVPVGQTEIGVMANTWCMIGGERNQIACDPLSERVAIVFRGNDRGESDGNTLYIRHSDNHGATWSPRGDNMATSANPRYPNICLPHATGSASAHTALTWAQVVGFGDGSDGFGEIHSMKAALDNSNPLYSTVVTPPNWGIPSEIIADQVSGALYCVSEAIEPANGAFTDEHYIMTSTDGGETWQPVSLSNPVFTGDLVPNGFFSTNMRLALSPDGSTMIAAFALIIESEPGRANILDSNHEIAWRYSTDNGQSWGELNRLRISDLAQKPDPFNAKCTMSWDLDVVLDRDNRPHFLTVCSADLNPFTPFDEAPTDSTINLLHVDSTFTTEIAMTGDNTWAMLPVGPARRVRIDRLSFTAGTNDESAWVFRNEPQWARSHDGTKLYAKWISPILSWRVANVAGQATLFADTLTQVYANGRHVDSLNLDAWAYEWDFVMPDHNPPELDSLMRLTALVDVGAKFSKIARLAGDSGELHVLYVEWGIGDTPDDDPVNSDQTVWYLHDSIIPDILLDADTDVSPLPVTVTLGQNYPNPFNPATSIPYSLPRTSTADLRVYDMLGREVAVLVSGEQMAGAHRAAFDADGLPSGMYLYRLTTNETSTSRIMMLTK
ncbi:MAG: hypothetical protein C0600_13610 [Ignavibacteria bacterium]|nr:MAG: hypothetical protein C0600_13610 [Ignavibacteria bacterium]